MLQNFRQHSPNSDGKSSDLTNTFLVPHGKTAMTTSEFIGFNTAWLRNESLPLLLFSLP